MMDASKVCRLCLKLEDTISDFLDLNENIQLVEIISQLLDIEIIDPNIDEDYYLCYDCHYVLQNFIEFKTKCKESDIEYRNRYLCKQEFSQEQQWNIEMEDIEVQPDIDSNIEMLLEEPDISSEITSDNSIESDSTITDDGSITTSVVRLEINKIRRNDKPKKPTWTELDRQKIPCHICGKLVFRPCYNGHVSLHDESKQRFQCTVCNRSYKQKHNLTKHLNSHIKKVQFHCKEENCGKVFKSTSALRIHHKNKHTDIRDHFCVICGRGYALSTGLRDHMRTHSTERKHACPECGKKFKTQTNVNIHLKVHTKRDPYVCPECNEAFPKACLLKEHRSDAHNFPNIDFLKS